MPCPLYPRERTTVTQRTGDCVGRTADMDVYERRRISFAYQDSNSRLSKIIIIIIIIIIFINCNWVDTRWQWLFYMYTKYDIDYY
jgi:hypothetical protein